jgi:type IV pilus assembly protein PilN
MARINLLPWREELRRERQRQFMMMLLATAILGVVLVFMVGTIYNQKIAHQQTRNGVISAQIAILETRIARIHELERTRGRLVSRKQVIEQLQASRSMTVELLDKLAKTIPVGLTLGTVTQQGMALTLTGSSQSNARVSAYLKSLEDNDLFLRPELSIVKTAPNPAFVTEPYDFTIKVKLRPPQTSTEGEFDDFNGGLQ